MHTFKFSHCTQNFSHYAQNHTTGWPTTHHAALQWPGNLLMKRMLIQLENMLGGEDVGSHAQQACLVERNHKKNKKLFCYTHAGMCVCVWGGG